MKVASIVNIHKLSLAWIEILWSPGVLKPRIQGLFILASSAHTTSKTSI